MSSDLTKLVGRLEVVTSRLEGLAASGGVAASGGSEGKDNVPIVCVYNYCRVK